MIKVDAGLGLTFTGLGLTFLSIAITFWAWFNGRQTKKMLKQWRDEDIHWRQEWQKTLADMQKHHDETLANMQKTLIDMQKHHDETIKYIADLIAAKTGKVEETN